MFPRMVKPEVCDKIVKDLLTHNLQPAKIAVYNNVLRDDPEIRKTSVYFVPPKIKSKASEIAWYFLKQANKEYFHYDLEFFQAVQFTKYSDGQFYDWHIDTYEEKESNKTRKLSLSLMLTDPDTFTGGEFQFYNGGRPFKDDEQMKNNLKAQGTIIVFDARDFHRVSPITTGVRHSIVCWATGVPFK